MVKNYRIVFLNWYVAYVKAFFPHHAVHKYLLVSRRRAFSYWGSDLDVAGGLPFWRSPSQSVTANRRDRSTPLKHYVSTATVLLATWQPAVISTRMSANGSRHRTALPPLRQRITYSSTSENQIDLITTHHKNNEMRNFRRYLASKDVLRSPTFWSFGTVRWDQPHNTNIHRTSPAFSALSLEHQ